MSVPSLPEPVKVLLYEHIHAYEELEALILMHRNPDKGWTARTVAEALAISDDLAADALKTLAARGIVDVFELTDSDTYYRGPREAFRAVVSELGACYDQSRLEIVMQLSTNSIERMRTGAMRAFADAFFIGKRKKDG